MRKKDGSRWRMVVYFISKSPLFPLLLGTLENPYNLTRQFEAGLFNQILTSSGKKVIGGS